MYTVKRPVTKLNWLKITFVSEKKFRENLLDLKLIKRFTRLEN